MVSYIETNFVLEIAFGQEEQDEARRILDAAQSGAIELAIPVFSLCEPYGTVTRRASTRREVVGMTQRQMRELGRAADHQEVVADLGPKLVYLLEAAEAEMDRLEGTVGELLECATVLPLTHEIIEASALHQREHGLQPADAIIYATVLSDATRRGVDEPKLFITRNSKDFQLPTISTQLREAGCDLLFDFAATRAHF